ncbi:flagellar hook assembly protein [Iodidimonas muriae]|uniref:Basal-body rod modification protein FlgD n=1 Tax=Iodidimonas muriae TaxID=261467 RepID=A0ABQ2LFE1_9PROT|nr:flagellar hook capping FlgD N-terminal domain-containing protein [Iodidimonas muriae]GER07802.1 flagellar hook assembly protein [Kordiimonadales bacterium JCM 17843]GGO15190.1 flagellar hook assembly protein [Iodidimonas muriae]
MDIASITAGLSGQTETVSNGIAQDFDTFLTLLTTQLQNQDPLEPTDSNEFTRQLVSFAGVEQQIQANENLQDLSTLTAFNQNAAAVNYLGKTVTIAGDTITNDGSTPLGFEYDLPVTADKVTVQILNADGDVVFEQDGETNFGIHRIDLSSFDGETPVPAGQYSVRVDARDADNKAIQTNSFVRARVDEVETSGLTPLLTIGGQRIPLHQIAAVAA